ncbi:unnamed protein product [Cylicostephanus goldi]|uniref:Uncharacterized protein n=1 Tax=Cylicostephanus goldi TaxID=71465 RepID=A0A3P6RQ34_CYLGO|nr:unnamed protein product [Cylicostephanus goldi]
MSNRVCIYHFFVPRMIPAPSPSKERKLLKPHNPGTSPVKICAAPVRSPLVTPTKSHGDRFIPIRKPNSEWTTRYNAIVCPDQESTTPFKRPNTNRPPAASTNISNNNGSPGSQYNPAQVRCLIITDLRFSNQ